MARRRMLSRRVSQSKKVNKLPLKAQIVWTWTIPFLDDYGCYTGDPEDIKTEVFPKNKKISEKDIRQALERMAEVGLVLWYSVNGDGLVQQYQNFDNFQTFKGDRTRKSDYPQYQPEKEGFVPVGNQRIPETSLKLSKVKLSKVKLKDKIEVFENFRKTYPGKKRGLDTEFDNFQKKHSDWKRVVEILKPAVEQQITERKKLKSANRFVPEWKHLRTWINQRCWEESTEFLEQREKKQVNEKKQRQKQLRQQYAGYFKTAKAKAMLQLRKDESQRFLWWLIDEIRPEIKDKCG